MGRWTHRRSVIGGARPSLGSTTALTTFLLQRLEFKYPSDRLASDWCSIVLHDLGCGRFDLDGPAFDFAPIQGPFIAPSASVASVITTNANPFGRPSSPLMTSTVMTAPCDAKVVLSCSCVVEKGRFPT